jgi:hypothetical protein
MRTRSPGVVKLLSIHLLALVPLGGCHLVVGDAGDAAAPGDASFNAPGDTAIDASMGTAMDLPYVLTAMDLPYVLMDANPDSNGCPSTPQPNGSACSTGPQTFCEYGQGLDVCLCMGVEGWLCCGDAIANFCPGDGGVSGGGPIVDGAPCCPNEYQSGSPLGPVPAQCALDCVNGRRATCTCDSTTWRFTCVDSPCGGDGGAPPVDGGQPCVTNNDCPLLGTIDLDAGIIEPVNQVCAYPMADGCAATGTCMPVPMPTCASIVYYCGCNGQPVAGGGCFYQPGYAGGPTTGATDCGDGGAPAVDMAAPLPPPLPTGCPCWTDADCPAGDACVAPRSCVPGSIDCRPGACEPLCPLDGGACPGGGSCAWYPPPTCCAVCFCASRDVCVGGAVDADAGACPVPDGGADMAP